jgi:hypothetical protein
MAVSCSLLKYKYMRFFRLPPRCDVTRHWVVIGYRRFGKTRPSYLQRSSCDILIIENGTTPCPETSVSHNHTTSLIRTEERRPNLCKALSSHLLHGHTSRFHAVRPFQKILSITFPSPLPELLFRQNVTIYN